MNRIFLTILAALTALAVHLLVAAAPARGEEGDRKLFAAGAGARAEALGGAYATVSDDATAPVWNPAGLLHAPSKEAAFYTRTLPASGFSYAYFGYAHPTLRYGSFGLGVMRFSASGIEGRDDRNVVTNASITDTQMRWLLSYANRATESVSFGLTLKVDTHTLAAASATSVGADAGLLWRPDGFGASALSLSRIGGAVKIENVLAPREKLGAEASPEPRSFRLGGSYELPVPGAARGALLALEFVHDEGGDQRLLVGGEVSQAGLAVRMGTAEAGWNAGAGARLHGLGVDYAYAPGDLSATHRISLGFAFGSTVDEMRAEAKEREERDVNERLARQIAEREDDRLASLLAKGREHQSAGRYAEAQEAFEGALLFAPDTAAVRTLLRAAREQGDMAQALERIASGDTVEALVDLQRVLRSNPANSEAQARIAAIAEVRAATSAAGAAAREKETAGVLALGSGRYAEALALFRELEAADPGSRDAARFRQLAEAGLSREVDLLVSQGNLLMERGLAVRAIAKWREALALSPRDKELKNRVEQAEIDTRGSVRPVLAGAPAEEGAAPAPLSEAEAAEVGGLYENGVGLFKEGKTDEAIEFWEIVWRRDPTFGDVKGYLTKGYLIQGMNEYTAGRLAKAIEIWQRALDVDPEDQKTLHYVERASDELAKTREITRR